MASPGALSPSRPDDLRERLIDAGLELLGRHGPAELTVRQIAEAAGTSTMGVYTKFGSRAGILEAIYRRGFDLLRVALGEVPEADAGDPVRHVLDLALAYRRFALANPALYAFLFEQPVPDFEPSPALRAEALDTTFALLVAAVQRATAKGAMSPSDPARTSVLVWCVAHGLVSLELTRAASGPLPRWLPGNPEVGERILLDGVRATLLGRGEGS
jgi:AcrR family transcriptional regulator